MSTYYNFKHICWLNPPADEFIPNFHGVLDATETISAESSTPLQDFCGVNDPLLR
jgi:hypothetical protein